jgi:hypothetical protein
VDVLALLGEDAGL